MEVASVSELEYCLVLCTPTIVWSLNRPCPPLQRDILINFFLIQTTTCMWQTKDEMKCENVKWKMWWYEEDFKCIMKLTRIQWIHVSLFRHTIYNKQQIKTGWADEWIEDEGYGMNNEWQSGRIKVPRGQSSQGRLSYLLLAQVEPHQK